MTDESKPEVVEKPKKKAAPPKPKRVVMVNPRNVAKREAQGYVKAKDYKGKTHTEQRALDAGDPVPMYAP